MLSKNTVSKQEMSSSKTKDAAGARLGGRLSQAGGMSHQSSFRDLCGQGGVQIGNTKVFFRQVPTLRCLVVLVVVAVVSRVAVGFAGIVGVYLFLVLRVLCRPRPMTV